MLREIKDVRQVPGEPRRRWFCDDDFDLIVWYQTKDTIVGFQLCYRKAGEDKALTWLRTSGFSHDTIDDGEGRPGRPKMSPVLAPDGFFDKESILPAFRKESTELDPAVAAFVCGKIAEYPGPNARR